MYSLGITLWQMLSRDCPYSGENQHVVIFGVVAYNMRPHMPVLGVDMSHPVEQCYVDLFMECWHAEPTKRPSASEVSHLMHTLYGYLFSGFKTFM